MTTRPTVSIPQLDALEAAGRGELSLSTDLFYDLGTWRIDGDGPAVTVSAASLFKRGLIEHGEPFTDSNGKPRVRGVVTDAGRELLADLASRAPAGEE